VRLMRIPVWGSAVPLLGTVTCGVFSWRTALLGLAILVTCGTLRLFTEWQRRKTFTEVLKGAPGGTVIVQHDGPGGKVMTVTWGSPSKDTAQPPGDCP
jgi:hypothetical protein